MPGILPKAGADTSALSGVEPQLTPNTHPDAEPRANAGEMPDSAADRGGRTAAFAALIVGATVMFANVLNVLFHFLTARLLVPEEYSLLATLFAVLGVLTVPALSLQAAVAREVAQRLDARDDAGAGLVVREVLAELWPRVLALVLLGIALAYPLARLTHVHRPLPILATAVAVVAALLAPIIWGGLQGARRFTAFGVSQAGYAAAKLAFGVALAAAGYGATAIMFSVALATVLVTAACAYPLRAMIAASQGTPRQHRGLSGRYLTGAAAALSLYMALTVTDLVVARLVFPPLQAAAYAAASVGARTLLVIPLAVTTVLFPRIAVLRDSVAERRHLVVGAGAVGLIAIVAAGIVVAEPEPLMHLAFGHKYDAATPWIGPLSFAMVFYAVINVYLFHFLAQGRSRYAWLLAATLLVQAAGYALAHRTPIELISVQIVIAAGALVASEIFDRSPWRQC